MVKVSKKSIDEKKIDEKKIDEKKIDKKIYFVIAITLIIFLIIYINYPTEKILKNNLDGICNDPEGKINDFYSKNTVNSGSDETGRIGFTDTCLKELSNNIDEVNLQVYLNRVYNFGGIDKDEVTSERGLLEGYCPDNIPKEFSEVNPFMMIKYYNCPNGCFEGACVKRT